LSSTDFRDYIKSCRAELERREPNIESMSANNVAVLVAQLMVEGWKPVASANPAVDALHAALDTHTILSVATIYSGVCDHTSHAALFKAGVHFAVDYEARRVLPILDWVKARAHNFPGLLASYADYRRAEPLMFPEPPGAQGEEAPNAVGGIDRTPSTFWRTSSAAEQVAQSQDPGAGTTFAGTIR
jgi:hypothetical protein